MNGTVELHFVPIEQQIADIFTKPLDESTFYKLVGELRMLNSTNQSVSCDAPNSGVKNLGRHV